MRPSAARTSSSPHNNIHPLLTDDDSDDENKRLDAELHKDLVNSLRDTVSAFGDSNFTLLWRVEYSRRVCAQIMLCLLSFLLRADSKLTDDTRVFLYHILSKQHRECTTLRRVWHLAPVLLSQQQQQRRRRRRRRRTRSLYIVPFERDGGERYRSSEAHQYHRCGGGESGFSPPSSSMMVSVLRLRRWLTTTPGGRHRPWTGLATPCVFFTNWT